MPSLAFVHVAAPRRPSLRHSCFGVLVAVERIGRRSLLSISFRRIGSGQQSAHLLQLKFSPFCLVEARRVACAHSSCRRRANCSIVNRPVVPSLSPGCRPGVVVVGAGPSAPKWFVVVRSLGGLGDFEREIHEPRPVARVLQPRSMRSCSPSVCAKTQTRGRASTPRMIEMVGPVAIARCVPS